MGEPNSVMTEETIRRIYGVECRIEQDEGRPHVVLGSALVL